MAIFTAIASAVSAIGSAIAGGISALGSALGFGAGAGVGGMAGLAGTALAVGGTIMQYSGQRKAQRGARQAEALRLRQMNVQAQRERRQTMRQAIIARSQALSQAEAQGASGGSGILGGLGNVASQAGDNLASIGMSQQIGQGMFGANSLISSGQTMANLGGTIAGIGNMFQSNWDVNRRVMGA